MALKKGVCKNFDNCDKADSNEIQEVESTEFKCAECGKDLHEIGVKPVTTGGSKKIVAIVAAVVVAAIIVVIGVERGFLFKGNDGGELPIHDTIVDTAHIKDTVNIKISNDTLVDTVVAEDTISKEKKQEPSQSKQQVVTKNETNLGWAIYEGPIQGGKPHGVGGTLKVTRSYSIDLKDGIGSTLDVYPGETIENTKFDNGRLRAGELHRHDGTRPYFNI